MRMYESKTLVKPTVYYVHVEWTNTHQVSAEQPKVINGLLIHLYQTSNLLLY